MLQWCTFLGAKRGWIIKCVQCENKISAIATVHCERDSPCWHRCKHCEDRNVLKWLFTRRDFNFETHKQESSAIIFGVIKDKSSWNITKSETVVAKSLKVVKMREIKAVKLSCQAWDIRLYSHQSRCCDGSPQRCALAVQQGESHLINITGLSVWRQAA